MFIDLFEIKDKELEPSSHCYENVSLHTIIKAYPTLYKKIFLYCFYMNCPYGRLNPYVNVAEVDKQEEILRELELDIDLETPEIQDCFEYCKKLYETPASRSYLAGKKAMENLERFLEFTAPTAGRDGSVKDIIDTLAKLPTLKKALSEFEQELNKDLMKVRGDKELPLDLQ